MDAGLIPVKRLDRAKERLSAVLDAPARRRLAEALLADALELCRRADFLRWWVVSDDPQVLRRATAAGVAVVGDGGGGLNPALAGALEAVAAAGARSTTIVPCDVPLARPGDIEDLVDTGATSDVVVTPSTNDGGTNALFLSPPGVLAPCFGPGSLRAHLAAADDVGLRASLLPLPRLALDLDTADDLRAFRALPDASLTHAGRVLESLPGED